MEIKLYDRIKRINPIIEGDRGMMNMLNACFENIYKNPMEKEHSLTDKYPNVHINKTGKCRVFYTPPVELIDSANQERLYSGLKMCNKELPYCFISKRGLEMGRVPGLVQELGYLEKCSEQGRGPNLLGVVAHHGFNICGLLMEDYTQHGQREVEFRPNEDGEDIAIIFTPAGQVERVYDGKRVKDINDEHFSRGRKYFRRGLRIDIYPE